MGYMRPRDAGQVLRANALDKAKKSGLTSEQVTDVLAFCDVSSYMPITCRNHH